MQLLLCGMAYHEELLVKEALCFLPRGNSELQAMPGGLLGYMVISMHNQSVEAIN